MNAQPGTSPLTPGGLRRPSTRQRATIAACAVVVGTCAVVSPALSAQTSAPPDRASDPSMDRRARVERLALDVLEVAKLPSLSVALLDGDHLDHDEPTLRFALGHENIEDDLPATPSTRYRAASVSKLFTATALARLVDADRATWDAPVAELVPTFPGLEGVTLRHLAGHLGGIGHYQSADQIERFRRRTCRRRSHSFGSLRAWDHPGRRCTTRPTATRCSRRPSKRQQRPRSSNWSSARSLRL